MIMGLVAMSPEALGWRGDPGLFRGEQSPQRGADVLAKVYEELRFAP
jgi:hypothetical protein